jgi:hypothetical protein
MIEVHYMHTWKYKKKTTQELLNWGKTILKPVGSPMPVSWVFTSSFCKVFPQSLIFCFIMLRFYILILRCPFFYGSIMVADGRYALEDKMLATCISPNSF